MAYVILQLALSLDGNIARPNGEVDFLGDIEPSFTPVFESFIKQIDTIVMGRNTYQKMLEYGDIPFADKTIKVCTTRPAKNSAHHVEFVNCDIRDIIVNETGTVWLFGGAQLIKQFINEDLIDEMQLYIVPYIIGRGIPLFMDNQGLHLELVSSQTFGQNVFLTYRRQSTK
ncbi:dihydrofolate reductase family protein [Candidatus Xianfuyuplasma coldseepsis]|uniref:Dihydrofolate reductase n=1 Tax=Candidatus Xianfuyuplasma coldseepsis TaxID=2782163 RepID=A0A7L7KRB8_9MOLU|nr:dihydrofolate reductase family protein [Xianfuyuplasma coldseepsis]QMS84822.1 dihydrofolate reductase [Xianfuyuplasma coldseepsis]